MRFELRACALVLVAAVCTGCLNAVTIVKVKPDGSGTIDQSLSMRKELADQVAGMMASFAQPQPDAKDAAPPDLFGEAQMRDAASKLGEGVTFVSSTPIMSPGRVGRAAVYAFKDITKLRIDQKPAMPGPDGLMVAGAPATARTESLTFAFSKQPNGTSLVSVVFEEPPSAAGAQSATRPSTATAPERKATPEQIELMKKLFDGLKIEMALEVMGTLVKTNAAYVAGNRVTLFELDFSQVLQNDALMHQMAAQPASIEEAKALLKNVKGVKLNLEKQLDVEFR